MLTGLDALLINDGEAKLLADNTNLVRRRTQDPGHGSESSGGQTRRIWGHCLLQRPAFNGAGPGSMTMPFHAPALPLDEVVDPTGAGDSFAGGFFGYLASQPEITLQNFKHAMFYGGVMGSFAVERFGTERTQSLTREEIDQRFALFRELSHFD